jgi:hypothetical protein
MFTGRKLALTLAFTVLVALAFGPSCQGFFQPETLSTIAINPTAPQVNVGQTQTLTAYGTYTDSSGNTTRNVLTSGVSWSSSPSGIATVTGTGSAILTGVSSGTTTITASAEALSATASATVIGNVSGITVSPTSATISVSGSGAAFTFTANPGPPNYITVDNGGTLVISPADGLITCTVSTDSNNNPDELCAATTGAGANGPYTIVMQYPSPSGSTVTSNPATLTVTQ